MFTALKTSLVSVAFNLRVTPTLIKFEDVAKLFKSVVLTFEILQPNKYNPKVDEPVVKLSNTLNENGIRSSVLN